LNFAKKSKKIRANFRIHKMKETRSLLEQCMRNLDFSSYSI